MLPGVITNNYFNVFTIIDWLDKVNEFCEISSTEFYDSCVNNVIVGVKNNTLDMEEIIKSWEKVFKDVRIDLKVYFVFLACIILVNLIISSVNTECLQFICFK